MGSLMYFGATVSGYAPALFIPFIVRSLDYSGIQSQVYSISVLVVAALITLIMG